MTKDSFIDKAKSDLKVIGRTANFAGHFAKYKLEIQQKKQEKERLLKQIGQSVFDLYKEHTTFDGAEVIEACGEDFEKYQQLEDDIAAIEEQIAQAKVDLKGGAVDAGPDSTSKD
jgi:hypothetical protein